MHMFSFKCACPNFQVVGVTAMACGMIAVGSCNGDVTSTILQTIMEKNEQELKDSYAHWLPLGLGLNHLGKNCNLQTYELTCKANISDSFL